MLLPKLPLVAVTTTRNLPPLFPQTIFGRLYTQLKRIWLPRFTMDTVEPPTLSTTSSQTQSTPQANGPSTSSTNSVPTTQPEATTTPSDSASISDRKGHSLSYYTQMYSVPTHGPDGKPLSKRQQKKAVKNARWEAGREDRKEARRLKRIQERQEYKEGVRNGRHGMAQVTCGGQ